MRALVCILAFVSWGISGLACAQEPPSKAYAPDVQPIEGYEPNTIGYTRNSVDDGFMDFTVSVKYNLLPQLVRGCISPQLTTYFAFTGRFGQYFSQESAPVLVKRLDPKLIFHYVPDSSIRATSEKPQCPDTRPTESTYGSQSALNPGRYFDLAYGHESNGQSIDSASEYQQAVADSKQPDRITNQISRSWDYLEGRWMEVLSRSENRLLASTLTIRYFLENGIFQHDAEEYNEWENDQEGKPRRNVGGLVARLEYHAKASLWNDVVRQPKVALIHETGYARPLQYNTVRLELGVKVAELPFTLWGQSGYNSDLAHYYQRASSFGIQVEMGSF